MPKSLTSNISLSQREKIFFRILEQELMKTTKMSTSGCYEQALLECHSRLTQSALIR
jgi:hypothetical protein